MRGHKYFHREIRKILSELSISLYYVELWWLYIVNQFHLQVITILHIRTLLSEDVQLTFKEICLSGMGMS